ncbi:poly(rC)-binding protein 3-like [Gigantopelta aegis]|uniref:poly(rC)-binding protein 3-like n=1 Tax=Gigantopelta aegis TaxID=1735272 RepID=UPI001B88845C|nr:poly(rC)-binding protein 3-like [Gigantopelta aegis]
MASTGPDDTWTKDASSNIWRVCTGEVDTVSTNIESGLLIRGESAVAVDNLETEHNSAAATMDSSTIPFTSGSCTISTTSTVSSNSSNLHLEPPITFRMLMTSKDISASKFSGDVSGSIPVTLKLIIQTSQCGSLIGKGGSKIKEIRETTGASIQVAGETLPNSTERAVTVSGTPEAITLCVREICDIMLESPPKGPFVPYKPHALQPNQAYQPRLIGCVIGRKGSKIHEIRVSSGAMIKIAGNEGDGTDRLVTITGTPESVGMAQYLITFKLCSTNK